MVTAEYAEPIHCTLEKMWRVTVKYNSSCCAVEYVLMVFAVHVHVVHNDNQTLIQGVRGAL